MFTLQVPVIENLETRTHSLLKQQSERLIERRQQDVKDQAEVFAAVQTGTSTVFLMHKLTKHISRTFRLSKLCTQIIAQAKIIACTI